MKTLPLKMGLRYLFRYRRLYSFLFFALLFCFAVITAVSAVYVYMSDNVYSAARVHYGGDVFLLGFNKKVDGIGYTGNNTRIQQAVESAGLANLKQIKRTNLQKKGTVYFNGKGIIHKNIFGIDIDNEMNLFSQLDFSEGSPDSMLDGRHVFISASVAEKLGVRYGDDILIKAPTVSGPINTGNFIVGGIIEDNSIFGYFRCFMDRKQLNRLVGLADEEYSSLGLVNNTKRSNAALAEKLYTSAAGVLPLSDPILKKENLTFEMGRKWKKLRYFVLSLDVFVTQVTVILDVLELISYFLYAMLLLITLGSAVITIRLILNERSGEIGVMKALGMHKKRLQAMLLTETALLIVFAVFFGFLLSLLILKIISFIPFKSIPGFDIFLHRNVLSGKIVTGRIFINIGVIFCIVLPAVSLNSRKIINEPCVKLLTGVKK